MTNPTIVIFSVIYFLEAVLTLLGNIFTIFVFWKRRAELKRTSYLLVNLAFADLLVTICISFLVGSGIRYLATNKISVDWVLITNLALDSFCGIASLLSLLLISLERLYAVRWPFRHRTLSTRSYVYSVGFVWVIASIILPLYLLSVIYFFPQLGRVCFLFTATLAFLVLVLVCATYMLIYKQTLHNIPQGFNERRAQQNRKLTNTLLVVTVLSLVCWVPEIIFSFVFSLNSVITGELNLLLIFKWLQYANSVVNPIVYTFRVPLFKSEIKKIFSKLCPAKKSRNIHFTQEIVTPGSDSSRAKNSSREKFTLYFDTKL